MSQHNHPPLWLELQTKYVDEHFDKLKEYLKKSNTVEAKQDIFYQGTLELLDRRVQELNKELGIRPLYDCDNESENREQYEYDLRFKASLLAVYLLVGDNESVLLLAYLSLVNVLMVLHPNHAKDLARLAVQRMQHTKVGHLGFTWTSLEQIGQEVFVYKLIQQAKFTKAHAKPLVYSNVGTAFLSKDALYLLPSKEDEAQQLLEHGADAMVTPMGLRLRTSDEYKIKSNQMGDFDLMEKFLDKFLEQQRSTQGPIIEHEPIPYVEGDRAMLRITRIEKNELQVETVDPERELIRGKIKSENLYYYYGESLLGAFQVGDYVTATLKNSKKGVFAFNLELAKFIAEDAERHGYDDFVGLLIDDSNPKTYTWLSDRGLPVYSSKSHSQTIGVFGKGDYARLKINKICEGDLLGRIEANIIGELEDEAELFDQYEVRDNFLADFVASFQPKEEESTTETINPQLLAQIIRILFRCQQSQPNPTDRFVLLSNALVLAHLIGDGESAHYLHFLLYNLKQILLFAKGKSFEAESPWWLEDYNDKPAPTTHIKILTLLKEYDKQGYNETLSAYIEDYQEDIPKIATLAKYILATNLLQDVEVDNARRLLIAKIMNTLNIEIELDETDGVEKFSYGMESGKQEFKTSIVFPPEYQMQPDESTQNRNVMRGICGFLNAQHAGTLYLGVDDLGHIVGLDNDIRQLKCQNMDSYKRYIAHVADDLLGKDVLPYLEITEEQEGRVVAIHVTPHPFRLVKLEGVAYLRTNSETRRMNDALCQQVLQRKHTLNSEKASILETLEYACGEHKCVLLRDYATADSTSSKERRLEVYDLAPKDNYFFAYDKGKGDCYLFDINQVGSVSILSDESWSPSDRHKRLSVDPFRQTGNLAIKVIMHLDQHARRLLLEAYPMAKAKITNLNNNDERCWHFEADVYDLVPVARFYLGLANHITIVETPQLEDYVQSFARKYLLPSES